MFWTKEKSLNNEMAAVPNISAKVFETMKKNWFILGVLSVIILARANPAIGVKGGQQIY